MIRPKPCANCGAKEGPMAFETDPWCSDDCRKQYYRDLSFTDPEDH